MIVGVGGRCPVIRLDLLLKLRELGLVALSDVDLAFVRQQRLVGGVEDERVEEGVLPVEVHVRGLHLAEHHHRALSADLRGRKGFHLSREEQLALSKRMQLVRVELLGASRQPGVTKGAVALLGLFLLV
jgi:hypothetical protein